MYSSRKGTEFVIMYLFETFRMIVFIGLQSVEFLLIAYYVCGKGGSVVLECWMHLKSCTQCCWVMYWDVLLYSMMLHLLGRHWITISQVASMVSVVSVMLKWTAVYFCLTCVWSFSHTGRLNLLFNFLVVCSFVEFVP